MILTQSIREVTFSLRCQSLGRCWTTVGPLQNNPPTGLAAAQIYRETLCSSRIRGEKTPEHSRTNSGTQTLETQRGHLVALKAKLLCGFLISRVYLFICRRLCDWMKEAAGREERSGTYKGTEREVKLAAADAVPESYKQTAHWRCNTTTLLFPLCPTF